MMGFNLLDECWIPVIRKDWQRAEVSLIELFQTWETVREIQADNPPTTLAIHRFLLAVLHRAYQGPRNIDHWEEIQQDNGKGAIEYLEKWRDRFDLFHPEHPFMQDMKLDLDKSVPIFAIHTMSTSKVFSHEHEWSGYGISSAEAARLLIRLQSVDITSLRAFYPNQTSGNRSAVNTPPINNANILVIGKSLQSTLMMNLIRYDPEAEFPSVVTGEDIPFWETSYAGKPAKSIPNGYISYLTYPWRRLNLFSNGVSVDRIAITMGNSFPDNLSFNQWECGIAFREGKPIRINPDRQLWRDSHSFLQSAEKESRPRIIEWLAQLSSEKLVDKLVCLQVFGMCADKAKPLAWSVEYFSAPILYIQDIQLSQALRIAITIAENHQQIFGGFRGSPYHALAETLNNNDAGSLGASLGGKAKYWAILDRKFQELLLALPEDKLTNGKSITYGNVELPKWTKAVQDAARDAFTDSIVSIRNYEARAKSLRALQWKLVDLRLSKSEKEERKSKSKSKKKEKASA